MDRDWPVPMDELREASTGARLAPLKERADAIDAEIREELAAMGLALVDRVRFERLRRIAATADPRGWKTPFPPDELWDATSALQPGDLDPLP